MNRRWRLTLLTTAAGLIGVVLMVAFVAVINRPEMRFRVDLSQSGEARLSSRTIEAMKALPEQAELTAFLFPEDQTLLTNGSTVYPQAFDRLRSYLEDLRIGSEGKLEVLVLEANSPLVLQQQSAEKLQRRPGDLVIVESGDGRKVLRFEDLFQVIQATPEGRPARLHRQRIDAAIGNALQQLASGKQALVGIVNGTGQGQLEDPQTLAPLASILRQEGYEVVAVRGPLEALELDCSLLIVPGQQRAMLPADREAAATWIAEQRPLLLALGAFAPDEAVADWNSLLADLGTGFAEGLVCAPMAFAGGFVEGRSQVSQLEITPEQISGDHPITLALVEAGRYLLFPTTRPLLFGAGNNSYGQERLVRSSRISWVDLVGGEAFTQNQGEKSGIQALAVAAAPWTAQSPEQSGRVVVSGSAEIMRRALGLDQDFVTASCSWLLGDDRERQGLVSLGELPYRPDQRSLTRLHNLTVLALPGCTFLVAFWIFWRRRR